MGTGRKSLILASFVLAAGQMFGASTANSHIPTVLSHPDKNPAILAKSKMAKLQHTKLTPAGQVTLAHEKHYAAALENGELKMLSQAIIDPAEMVTTASLTKILSAAAVLDKTGSNIAADDFLLVKEAILHSRNTAIEGVAYNVADPNAVKGKRRPKEETIRANPYVLDMLRSKVTQLNLNDQYNVGNASGYPNLPHDQRNDTFASPKALLTVAIDLVKNHADTLDQIYCNAVASDLPTNNLFCPSGVAGSKVRMYAKTGTDMFQNHSMVVVVTDGENYYGIYHRHDKKDPRSPISTMASIVREFLLEHTQIRDPALFNLLDADAAGTIKPDNVAIGRAPHAKPEIQVLSAKKPTRHLNPPNITSALAVGIIPNHP